jgi:hypothetical protein
MRLEGVRFWPMADNRQARITTRVLRHLGRRRISVVCVRRPYRRSRVPKHKNGSSSHTGPRTSTIRSPSSPGIQLDAHFQNRYTSFVASDNYLCLPVVQPVLLNAILGRMTELAEAMVGNGPKPQVSYDLEHLQVASYADFTDDEQQKSAIRDLQSASPIRSDEMAYMALRSMIGLSWEGVTSEEDIRRAAAYEKALELTLVEASPTLGQSISRPDSLLPYWGRLAFLRVMTSIPEDQIQSQRLDRVACVLLKTPHSMLGPICTKRTVSSG